MFARLMAKLGLDATGYHVGLKRAETASTKFARVTGAAIRSSIGGAFAGVLGGYAIARYGKQALESAGQVRTLADSYGLTAEQVQKLKWAAAQSNISQDTLFKAQKNFARVLVDTKDGSTAYADALSRLGISMDEVQNADHFELFTRLSESIKDASINTEKLADIQKVFGRAGVDSIAAMSQGLLTLSKQADELGIIISQSDILELAAAGDELTAYGFKWDAFWSRTTLKALRYGEILKNMVWASITGQNAAFAGAATMSMQEAERTLRERNKKERAPRDTFTSSFEGGMNAGGVKSRLSNLAQIGVFGAQRDVGLRRVLDKVEVNTRRTAKATEEINRDSGL